MTTQTSSLRYVWLPKSILYILISIMTKTKLRQRRNRVEKDKESRSMRVLALNLASVSVLLNLVVALSQFANRGVSQKMIATSKRLLLFRWPWNYHLCIFKTIQVQSLSLYLWLCLIEAVSQKEKKRKRVSQVAKSRQKVRFFSKKFKSSSHHLQNEASSISKIRLERGISA